MEIVQTILSVVIIILLTVILVKQKKSDAADGRGIADMLNKNSGEQRDTVAKQLNDSATEQFKRFGVIQQSVQSTLQGNREEVNKQLREFQERIDARISAIHQSGAESNEKINSSVNQTLHNNREEITKQLREFGEQLDSRLSSIQRGNTESIEKVNLTLENKMKSLQESNEKRLDQMRGVVDEKLQKTLETRLAQSFELVSKQLDSVQQGLGEMKNLAADAKSLKKALTNVTDRGAYGEVRLEKLLSDILAPNQYVTNAQIKDNKRVEFAVKLPGNGDGDSVLLPIDSKFPIEDYNRLLDAEDRQAIDEARKSLFQKLRSFAKDIGDKYIEPPKTTSFALMFLPTEGLFAEVVKNVALVEEMRDRYNVTVVGITTLSAFLNSLQMGFKTLAIEQRSHEVWDTLRSVKSEFLKFGKKLESAQNQVRTVDRTLAEIAGVRSRKIDKALESVEELVEVENEPSAFIGAESGEAIDDGDVF